MKKWCLKTGLVFLMFSMLGLVSAGIASAQAEWTIMVYLDGDNNLEGAAWDDLGEMESAGSSSDVNVIVQLDPYDDCTGTYRYRVTGATAGSTAPYYPDDIVETLSEQNMANPAVLADFANWAMTEYPADKYLLVVWNHGGGWRLRAPVHKGVIWDDTSIDFMTMAELAQGLAGVTQQIDVIGFDACLMQMSEVAWELISEPTILPCYMVGSEEVEPWDGWPYDVILTNLSSNPTMNEETLCSTIVTDYVNSYPLGYGITQSALHFTTQICDNFTTVINSFADALMNSSYQSEIASARVSAQNYYEPKYKDLYDFAQKIYKYVLDCQAQAQGIMDFVDTLVIAKAHSGSSVADSYGLSIFLPDTSAGYDPDYDLLNFATDTRWDEFLQFGPGGIQLTVLNYEGNPAQYAMVYVYSGVPEYSDWEGSTDENGYVSIDIPESTYTLVASSWRDYFYMVKENVTSPSIITLDAGVETVPININAKKIDGNPLSGAYILFTISPWPDEVCETDENGLATCYVSPYTYRDIFAWSWDNLYYLYKSNVTITNPTTIDFDAASMPTGEIITQLLDFPEGRLAAWLEEIWLGPGFSVNNGSHLIFSEGSYWMAGSLFKTDGTGKRWEFELGSGLVDIASNSSTTLSGGGDFTVNLASDASKYSAGASVDLDCSIMDSFDNQITWSETYTSDAQRPKILPKEDYISILKKIRGYEGNYPTLTVTDPDGNLFLEESSSQLFYGYDFTLPSDATLGIWTVNLSFDTGPHQGAIEKNITFEVGEYVSGVFASAMTYHSYRIANLEKKINELKAKGKLPENFRFVKPRESKQIIDHVVYIYWDAYSDAEGYKIYRSTNGTDYTLLVDLPTSEFSDPEYPYYHDYNVAEGESYYYYVTAYNGWGDTSPSDTAATTVLPSISLISPENGTVVYNSTPTFNWDPVGIANFPYGVIASGVSELGVYNEGGWWIYFNDMITDSATYNLEGEAPSLVDGHTYGWETWAYGMNSDGWYIAYSDSEWWKFTYIPTLSDIAQELINLIREAGFEPVAENSNFIDQGQERTFSYRLYEIKDLMFALGWKGSILKLSMYKPDGGLYQEEQSDTSPILISIPNAEVGEWKYKITAVDVPYDDYPFVVEIGAKGVTPPTGTIVINGGATYTNSREVTLTLSAENAAQMCFSNDNSSWGSWEGYATSKSWTLTSGDGEKTVYVKFKNAGGVESDVYFDTIILDTIAPTGSISINKGAAYTNSRSVTLTLSATGASVMCFSNNSSSWSGWENYATSKSWTLTSGDGTKKVYVKFKDSAGNVSKAYSDTIILDTTPPKIAITSPEANTYVGGTLNIIGTATDTHFRKYKLYYGKGESPATWNLIKESSSSVNKATLGSWDTTKFPDGTYILKLWADDKANNSAETKNKVFVDNTPPEIKNLTLDQENFIPGDYASSTPTILATLTDVGSGVDERTIDLRIKPREGDEIVVPAFSIFFNSETGEMSYTVTEPLADSEYEVALGVKDKVGNNAEEKTTEFVVDSELTMMKILNYPNPFSSGTKFTYHLTRDVDEVTIKVYTVAGELVKTIDFASSHVGYNEEEWDGINDYGEELANGTYPYKITVKLGDEKVSKVQMLTVLK